VSRLRGWLARHKDTIFLCAFVLVLCGAVLVRAEQLDNSTRHALCPIVRLVIAHPVPRPSNPAANPSRVATYQMYEDFVIVKRQYGCR
jgi:hypothetical protein